MNLVKGELKIDRNIYYVYSHFDPETNEIVYIGKGCSGRAWDVTRSRKENSKHQEWMNSLMGQGYIPSDWVQILHRNLSEKKAYELEIKEIHKHYPTKFNRQSGENQHQAKLTNDQALEIFKKHHFENQKPSELAEMYGVSKAAVYMIIKRKQWKAITAGVNIDNKK